ncbi:iron ABC transporter ATP-binding protein [Methanococcoides methylutens]|uniref:Cobalamin import ATP-binding protein BtuD n=1 Tax=Methanococcoides methylutens TaxID=2226 RepID=A0A099SYK5_METMT|nr:ABC transporter ATP-binding protein [Methanococcoides methylutens]KGK97729.1 iron ABC transporter ATP-binding protein [Methanococcoides methylutens]
MILRVNNASYSYDGKKNVFENISFSLNKGETLCILGPNGIGKSTLIKCLGNVLNLSNGNAYIDGRDVSSMSRTEIAKKIGYVPQADQSVFPFSILDFVMLGRAPHLPFFSSPGEKDLKIAENAIVKVGISHLMDSSVTEISGGEKQLALIARALAQEPEILLLDEPTSHLDFGNQVRVLNLIDKLSSQGTSVIMSTHFPDHAFIGSKNVAIMLENNFIAQGTAEEVITKENMTLAYGIDVAIDHVSSVQRKVCLPL